MRNTRGYSVAEIPAVLFVLFVMLTFPLLNLATITLRYTFCALAVQEAATEAAVSKTFQSNVSAQDLSAVNSAQASITRVLSRFSGISQKNHRVHLLTANINSGQITSQLTRLSTPADTKVNVYMVESELDAFVDPLVTMTIQGLDIPGITGPLEAKVTARKYVENPQGLNQ